MLDEATAFLGQDGKREILALIRAVAGDGAGVLFVTHDLNEALAAADRISVLRDGRHMATMAKDAATLERVVEVLTGLEYGRLANADYRRPVGKERAEARMVVEGLSGGFVRDFSMSARRGEIVGLTGLVGAGWEEVPALLYGAEQATTGTLAIDGAVVPLPTISPSASIAGGIAFVPADRVNEATIPDLSVRDNAGQPALGRYAPHGILNTRRLTRDVRGLLVDYTVKPPQPALPVSALSGGNQQKVVLAKWLNLDLRLLLLAEPTQGVDVGARAEILRLIRQAADGGTCVVYAAADFAEVARVADRVIVITDGVTSAELSGSEVTEERIAGAAFRRPANIDPSEVDAMDETEPKGYHT